MYKAAAQHPLLGWIFRQKSEITYLSWYSLRRHRTVTDVVLPKNSNSWDVKDLLNLYFTWLWSETYLKTYCNIKNESGHRQRENFSRKYIRPQRSSMAHGINHRLVFDYQRYLWQSLSLACSDMKSCCDRIVHSAASLSLQCLGIHILEIIIMLDTIKRMSHTVRRAYGDSNLTYRGDKIPDDFSYFVMIHCQVNGSSPQIWSIISSVVLS